MNSKLVIVANLGHLKAYKVHSTRLGNPRLELLQSMPIEDARRRVLEVVSDLAGRRGGPAQRNWGAPVADDHNIRLETKRRLVRKIVEQIERLDREHTPSGLLVGAEKTIHPMIMERLSRNVRERVQMSLVRDLVKTGKAELLEVFGLRNEDQIPSSRLRSSFNGSR